MASHGALHLQAEAYIKKHSYKKYRDIEIERSITSMAKAGFSSVSFAYPSLDNNNPYSFDINFLTFILDEAKKRNLKFYRFMDLVK